MWMYPLAYGNALDTMIFLTFSLIARAIVWNAAHYATPREHGQD
jgi:hypothetical protein